VELVAVVDTSEARRREIGARLNVETILEGSVRRVGSRIRVTAQLVKASDGYHLWSQRFDREMTDVFAIQDEISQKVVRALEVELSDKERNILGKAPTHSVEAYEFYLRGRQFFYKSKRRSIQCALEMLTRAAGKDPTFAQAWAGMADCYSYLFMYFGRQAIPCTDANFSKPPLPPLALPRCRPLPLLR
jgi:hypothetical protein